MRTSASPTGYPPKSQGAAHPRKPVHHVLIETEHRDPPEDTQKDGLPAKRITAPIETIGDLTKRHETHRQTIAGQFGERRTLSALPLRKSMSRSVSTR